MVSINKATGWIKLKGRAGLSEWALVIIYEAFSYLHYVPLNTSRSRNDRQNKLLLVELSSFSSWSLRLLRSSPTASQFLCDLKAREGQSNYHKTSLRNVVKHILEPSYRAGSAMKCSVQKGQTGNNHHISWSSAFRPAIQVSVLVDIRPTVVYKPH